MSPLTYLNPFAVRASTAAESTPSSWKLLGILLTALLVATDATAQARRSDGLYFKDGAYNTFQLRKQDTNRFGPNAHPVQLEAKDLEPIFRAISLRAEGLFAGGDVGSLFSQNQATLLATQVSRGLALATPEQDIVFVLQRRARRLVLLSSEALTSGRIFFADGKLNIIIGEFDRARNREFERLFDTTGAVNPYDLSNGNRKRNSGSVNASLIPISGISMAVVKDKQRSDWFVIDVPEALAALAGEPAPEAAFAAGRAGPVAPAAPAGVSSDEAQALRTQQEEMQREMARLQEQLDAGEAAPTPPTPVRLPGAEIEERLRLLIKLYDEGLINQQEYDAKRREILSEL